MGCGHRLFWYFLYLSMSLFFYKKELYFGRVTDVLFIFVENATFNASCTWEKNSALFLFNLFHLQS